MRQVTRRTALSMLAGTPGLLAAPAVFGQGSGSSIAIATGVDPSFAPVVAAMRKGFFARHGVKADLRIFDDGSVALDSLLTGAGDVGSTVEFGGNARRAKGGQLFVTGYANYTDEFYGLVGKEAITSARDIIGKTVSLSVRGGPAHLFLTNYMKANGSDISQVKIKFVGAPESVAALARGDVDVLCGGEPWLARAVEAVPDTHYVMKQKRGDARIFRLSDYFYFGKRLMDDPSLAKAVMQALIEGSDWVPANLDEAVRMSADVYRTPLETSASIIRMFDYKVSFTPEIRANFLAAAEFQKSLGVLSDIPDMDTFLRPEILQAVAPDRVTSA